MLDCIFINVHVYFYKLNKKNSNFKLIKRKANVADIINFLNKKIPLLIINNVAVIFKKHKFWPHYIDIVGYDKDNFYIHNVALKNQKFQKVKKELLNKSWDCGGVNHNLIAIER